MVHLLVKLSHLTTTLEDLSSGFEDSVIHGNFVNGNCGNKLLLDNLITDNFDVVMHFATFVEVGESVIDPGKYYLNNSCYDILMLPVLIQMN